MNGLIKHSYQVGRIFMITIMIQWLIVTHTFKKFIILGFFPAILSGFRVLNTLQQTEFNNYEQIKTLYQSYYKKDFKISNQTGYILLLFGLILALDFQISELWIQNPFLQGFLIVLLIAYLGTLLFILPVLDRYDLSVKHSIKQSFFLFILSPFQTIAICLCLLTLPLLWLFVPITIAFSSFSILFYCILIFSNQSISSIEEKRRFYDEQN